jgi:hypothetical protein
VAGLKTGPDRCEEPDVNEPATQCWICFMLRTLVNPRRTRHSGNRCNFHR